MKIGILTFHSAANYGAVLQAYGLQETLKKLGHMVYIIDYKPEYLKAPYKNWTFQNASSLNLSAKNFVRALAVYGIRRARNRKFAYFVNEHLNLLSLEKIEDMEVLIVGSDQIWNPNITAEEFDEYFTLNKITSDKIKIAYAASAGNVDNIRKKANQDFFKALGRFDAISVREDKLGHFLGENGIKVNASVLDPVLLAGANVFEPFTKKSLVPQDPYLLYFTLSHDKTVSQLAKDLARKKGLRYVECCSMDESPFSLNLIQSASVEKFLSLLKYSAFTVTNSFHGTAFSILFKKDFISVADSLKSADRTRSTLESLGLLERLVLLDRKFENNFEPIDYNKVNYRHNKLQEHSTAFIINALSRLN